MSKLFRACSVSFWRYLLARRASEGFDRSGRPVGLLEAAVALDPDHFEQFMGEFLRVRVGADETELLVKINAGIDPPKPAGTNRVATGILAATPEKRNEHNC